MAKRLINPSATKTEPGEFYEFTVDAALLKELGERLVGKPHIALAELVKNAYDADATKVRITFEHDAIEIADNGDGMSKAEFKKFWMRVGTTHKQDSPVTPLFKRKVSGSKGVGRLSVQFLGNSLSLWSVSRASTSVAFRAEVDWRKAQQSASLVKSGATVFGSTASGVLPDGFAHGTRLRIEGLNQTWDAEGLRGSCVHPSHSARTSSRKTRSTSNLKALPRKNGPRSNPSWTRPSRVGSRRSKAA
jgi:hypothetical protein